MAKVEATQHVSIEANKGDVIQITLGGTAGGFPVTVTPLVIQIEVEGPQKGSIRLFSGPTNRQETDLPLVQEARTEKLYDPHGNRLQVVTFGVQLNEPKS